MSNLDFDFLLPLPDSPKEAAMEKLKTMVDEMIAPKFDMASRAPGPNPTPRDPRVRPPGVSHPDGWTGVASSLRPVSPGILREAL